MSGFLGSVLGGYRADSLFLDAGSCRALDVPTLHAPHQSNKKPAPSRSQLACANTPNPAPVNDRLACEWLRIVQAHGSVG